jgi:hypothetical protein
MIRDMREMTSLCCVRTQKELGHIGTGSQTCSLQNYEKQMFADGILV